MKTRVTIRPGNRLRITAPCTIAFEHGKNVTQGSVKTFESHLIIEGPGAAVEASPPAIVEVLEADPQPAEGQTTKARK